MNLCIPHISHPKIIMILIYLHTLVLMHDILKSNPIFLYKQVFISLFNSVLLTQFCTQFLQKNLFNMKLSCCISKWSDMTSILELASTALFQSSIQYSTRNISLHFHYAFEIHMFKHVYLGYQLDFKLFFHAFNHMQQHFVCLPQAHLHIFFTNYFNS